MKSSILFVISCISMTFCVCQDTDFFLNYLGNCRRTYHSCDSGSKNVYCSCDRMCVYYDNCCYDAAIKRDWEEMSDEDQHRRYLQMTTCEVIAFRKEELFTQGAFMISSCPVSWKSDIHTRHSCELYTETDVRDTLPVVDITTNITFKNRFCAKCHSVEKYLPWILEIECFPEIIPPSHSITEGVMTKLHSDLCSHRFTPPNDVTVHYCYKGFDYAIISNSFDGNNNSTCWNRVFSPVVVDRGNNPRYFRTLECFIDNEGLTYTDTLNVTTCALFETAYSTGSLKTLSYLIDFSLVLRRQMTKCKDKEIQLSDEIGCRRLHCPARSEPSDGECVDVNYTTDGFMLDLLFEIDNGQLMHYDLFRILTPITDTFLVVLSNHTGSILTYDNLYIIKKSIDNYISGTQLNSGNSCSVIHILVPVKGLTLRGDALESGRHQAAIFFNNYTLRNSDGSIIKHIANTEYMSCKTNVSFSNPLYLQEIISLDNDLPCPAVKLQYSGNESDTTSLLYFHLQEINISSLDVVSANGGYFLCVDTFLLKYLVTYQQHSIIDIYRSYINTICTSISIMCMVYCLFQYCAIPILRDGKSDMLIVLLLFLLLAQTCFFLFSHIEIPKNVCEWFGVIHHFTWLVAFAFMFLCPYRLNAEIRDLQTYSRSERMTATVKYILVGILFPLFVIICTKVTNLILVPTENWYGGRLCFISRTFVLLFSYVVPVFFILCGNVFLFIRIIRYITATSIAANSNRSNMNIFIKISIIMGFSWIIGIVAIISQSDILRLVFEVLANLQGAFITISFLCSNRVRTFYKECFQRVKNTS